MIRVAVMLVALSALTACMDSSDDIQRLQQEQILKEGTAQTGMPAIKNFRERKMLKEILEFRPAFLEPLLLARDLLTIEEDKRIGQFLFHGQLGRVGKIAAGCCGRDRKRHRQTSRAKHESAEHGDPSRKWLLGKISDASQKRRATTLLRSVANHGYTHQKTAVTRANQFGVPIGIIA